MKAKQRRALMFGRVSQDTTKKQNGAKEQVKTCSPVMKKYVEAFLPMLETVSATGGNDGVEWPKLLDRVSAGQVDVVVCRHIDRLTRDMADGVDLVAAAKKGGGLIVHSVHGGEYDLMTGAGAAAFYSEVAAAERETKIKSERHGQGNAKAIRKGKRLGGRPPFGYGQTKVKKDGTVTKVKRHDLHPVEAPLLRSGIDDYLSGVPLSQIAATWNEAGVRTRDGNEWLHDSVRKALVRPSNAGIYVHRGVVRDDVKKVKWEPICTVEEYERMAAIAEGGKVGHRPSKNLLSGHMTCEHGHEMAAAVRNNKTTKGVLHVSTAYRCVKNEAGCTISIRRRDPDAPKPPPSKVDTADALIRRLVLKRLLSADLRDLVGPDALSVDRHLKITAKIGDAKAKRSRFEADYISGHIKPSSWDTARTRLDTEIEDLTAERRKLEEEDAFAAMLTEVGKPRSSVDPLTATAEELDGIEGSLSRAAAIGRRFDALPLRQRQTIVKNLFPRIVVAGVGPRGTKGPRPTVEQRMSVYLPSGERFVLSDDNEDYEDQ